VKTDDQWMRMEGQLVQLAGEVRDRRARMRRLQEVLDDARAELGLLERDARHLRDGQPPGTLVATGPFDASAMLVAQQNAIEALLAQVRELVALHRVFRDLSRMLREVSGNHEARLRMLERRLLIGVDPAVH
jgi:hypothetical protein